MDKDFKVLSLEDYKKRMKAASANISVLSSKTLQKVRIAESEVNSIVPPASCTHSDNDSHQTDASSEFLNNCRALNIKPNTLLLQKAEAIRNDKVVKLAENYIGSIAFQALAPLIAKNPNLQMLYVPNNGLNNNAVVFLCRSLKGHASLRLLDLSGNHDLSLPGGLALLTFVRQCPSLVHVELGNTQVPNEVITKITKACHLKAFEPQQGKPYPDSLSPLPSHATAADLSKRHKSPSPPLIPTRLQPIVEAKADRSDAASTAWGLKERQLLAQLEERLRSSNATKTLADASALPPADPNTGWRVVEVAILAPPRLFHSELQQLLRVVFPRLNDELHGYQILLLPLVVGCGGVEGCDPPPSSTTPSSSTSLPKGVIGPEFRYLRLIPPCDILADVRRSRFLTIELLGDRQGDYELTASSFQRNARPAGGAADGAAPFRPVLYAAHALAAARSRHRVVALRRDTKFMGVPPALAGLLSAEPRVENPDIYHDLVKKVLPSFAGARPFEFVYDRAVEERAWGEHLSFRAGVLAELPMPELFVGPYPCSFEKIDDFGNVCLGDLDEFAQAIYQRLRLLIFSALPSTKDVEGADPSEKSRWDLRLLDDALEQRGGAKATMNLITASGGVKKALSDQLNLYLISPISRNSFAVCANDNAMLSAVLATTATTAVKRFERDSAISASDLSQGHIFAGVAFYSTRTTLFEEEPTDLHAVMRSILTQLTTSPEVLRYLALEVDTERLQGFFIKFLSGRSAAESKVRLKSIMRSQTDDLEEDLPIPDCDTTTLAMPGEGGQDRSVKATTPTTTTTTTTTISTSSNTLIKMTLQPERIFAVILDGIDDIDAPVKPCEALYAARDGENPFNRTEKANERRKKPRPLSASRFGRGKISTEELLPRYLARNVRVLLSCGVGSGNENGQTSRDKLQGLDRDSMEVLNIGLNSVHNVERLLSPAVLAKLGISLTDDEVDLARYKHDIQQNPEYLNYLIDELCINAEEAGSLSTTQLLNQLPNTIEEMTKRVYDRLVDHFGSSLVYRMFGLLRVARWGIPELHLRMLTKLPPQRFRQMLRYTRVVTELSRLFYLKYIESDRDLPNSAVRLASPAFKAFLSHLEKKPCKAYASYPRPTFHDKAAPPPDSAQIDRSVWHEHLAKYYLSIAQKSLEGSALLSCPSADNNSSTSSLSPYERHAVKELPYHLAQAEMWGLFDAVVLSVPYLVLVYRHNLAYAYLRELIAAFNLRHGGFVEGAGGGEAMPLSLRRLREYVFFVREKSRVLLREPGMVVQACVERPRGGGGGVWADARGLLLRVRELARGGAAGVFFRALPAGGAHFGPLAALRFTPNGRFLISGGADRAVCWRDPARAAGVLFRARSPSAGVAGLVCCRANSAYVGALLEDRGFHVYDAASGSLVSAHGARETARGLRSTAPIAAVHFSPRGRYFFLASEDLAVGVYASESAGLVAELGWRDLLRCPAGPSAPGGSIYARRGFLHVLPHPTLDEVFACIVNEKMLLWRVADSKDACVPISNELLPLSGRVRQAEWLPIESRQKAAIPSSPDRADAVRLAETEGPSLPYILLTYVEHGRSAELFDLDRCRIIRSFALPLEMTFVRHFVCSDDHARLALDTSDGEVLIYPLQGGAMGSASSVSPALSDKGDDNGEEPRMQVVSPYFCINVFGSPQHCSQQTFSSLAFYEGSSALLTLGNGVELKYWELPTVHANKKQIDRTGFPNDTDDDGDVKSEYSCQTISKPHGRILLPRPARCWCTAPTRTIEKGMDTSDSTTVEEDAKCSIAVGDEKGCVTLFSIWKP